ncbi:putative Ig domain-containing protein [Actinoplanes sp. NPDC049265]|uniref:putative Ig domain-containing protein n=1 Tax=Actinoplanes sp. NPDC049265 TaxID=3363902 RepID=UPI00370F84EE
MPKPPAHRRFRWRATGDDGFSLLEVLVSLAVIGTVMAGTAPFLIKSVTVVAQQRTQQVAVEVANDAVERARALSPTSLLAGRTLASATTQLATAPAQVQSVLDSTQISANSILTTLLGSSPDVTAPLPLTPLPVTIGGVTYQQNWYVGSCFQTKAVTPLSVVNTLVGLGDCVGTKPIVGIAVPYFRVVVAVTWSHSACPGGQCVYVTSTLVSPSADPVFDLKRPPPAIVSPGKQSTYVGEAVSIQLVAAGGTLPRTWTLTSLPPGLTASSGGVITGNPTTAGTYTVSAHVEDRDKNSDDATFTWVVADLPALTSPGAQVFRTLTAVSLPVTLTGGLAPMVWTATGLPAGLVINASTGVITGTPLTTQATPQTATVKAADSLGKKSATTTFTWRVYTPVKLLSIVTQNATKGDNGAYNLGAAASGGLAPYTFSATGLPAGVTINATTGQTSGIITAASRYLVTATVTDSLGGTSSIVVLVNVAPRVGTDLRVITPAPATPNQTSAVGATVSLTATAGGQSGLSWTASGLPPGLAMSTGGVVTGKPTTAGTYTTTFTVTGGGQSAYLMFTWTVI